jgi:hypothetical protein
MQEKEYEALCDMFMSEGWKFFIKGITDLEENITQIAPDAADTNDKWQYARGKINQLRTTMGYEQWIKMCWEGQQAEVEPEAEVDVNVI